MIKGKYVATIELNFHINEPAPGLAPFDVVKKQVTDGELDRTIVAILADEFGELCSVGLTKLYADLYKIGGNDNETD